LLLRRGARQEVGRHVRKGERAFYILAPSLRRAEAKDGEPQDKAEFVVAGFVCVPVFGYSQTEGDPLPGAEEEAAFLSALPLVEVAGQAKTPPGVNLVIQASPEGLEYRDNRSVLTGNIH
jgi:hypothetical protein